MVTIEPVPCAPPLTPHNYSPIDRLSPHWISHAGQTKSNTLNNPPSVNILESNRAQAEAYTDTVIEMYTAF